MAVFARQVQRPVPASAVARLHPLTTAPQAGVLPCAAETQSRSYRSGKLHLSLRAEPRRTRIGPSHRQSSLDCLGTLRRGERLQSVDEVKEDLEAKSFGVLRNPNAAVAANPGLPLLRVQIREVLEVRSRIPRAPLGSRGHSWLSQRLGPLCASRALCESPPSCHTQCRKGQVSLRVPLVQYARLRAAP